MLVATPIVVSLCAAVVSMLWHRKILTGFVACLFLFCFYFYFCLLEPNGVISMHAGDWPEFYAILMSIGNLNYKFGMLFSLVSLISIILLSQENEDSQKYFTPLVFFTLLGINGLLLTDDIFNLYVWLEVSFLGILGMFIYSGKEYGLKYFGAHFLNSIAILLSIGLIYGVTGSLSLHSMARLNSPVGLFASAFLALGLLFKAGIWPYSTWLEKLYTRLPTSMMVFLAGISTKSILYVIYKIGFHDLKIPMLFFGSITVITSSIKLLFERSWNRVVLTLMIGQTGLSVILISVLPELLWITVLHDVLSKLSLLMLNKRCGGVALTCMAITGMSMIGIPPFFGFWVKLWTLRGLCSLSMYYCLGLIMLLQLSSVLSLRHMLRNMIFQNNHNLRFLSIASLLSFHLVLLGIFFPIFS